MPKISFPFIGETYQSRSKAIAGCECVNWYVQKDKEGKNFTSLIGRPGLKYLTTYAGIGGNRGMFTTSGDRAFYVVANKLVEFTTAGAATERGTILTITGQCCMAENGKQLMIVDGLYGYVYNLKDNTLTHLNATDYPDFPGNITDNPDGETGLPLGGCSHVAFVDGYFIVNKDNVSQYNMFPSGIYDGLSWDAGQVFSAEASPDGLTALIENNNELFCFGNKSMQIFYNSGDPDQPFAPQRVAGGHLNIGCYAPHSVDSIGNTVFWLGSNEQGSGIVFSVAGYQPSRISNHAIEYVISTMAETSNAIGFCYQQEGHSFYVLTFPTGQKTLVYDMATGLWHTRTTGEYAFWLGQNHCFMGTRNYIGDFTNGNIYYLDFDTYTDNSELFETVRTCQHIHKEGRRVFFHSFELDFERGVGLTNDLSSVDTSSNPQAILTWSDDGGNTWSNEYAVSLGKVGEYFTRAKWNRLGSSRDRMYSVKIVAPVKRVITGAVMDTTVGVN